MSFIFWKGISDQTSEPRRMQEDVQAWQKLAPEYLPLKTCSTASSIALLSVLKGRFLCEEREAKSHQSFCWLVSDHIYDSVPTDQSPKETHEGLSVFRALNSALSCPGLVGVILCSPRYNTCCPASPHLKTSEESRRTSATPKGCRVGLGSGTAVEIHLLVASAGTSWVSCCSSPSWPSLFQSLPKNCYVPVDHCAKQRGLIFGSAIPFSLFCTGRRKRSQVLQIFLPFSSTSLQLAINYSKAWISPETLKPTPHMP